MGCASEQQEPSEIGSAKWSWLCVPLAGFAFAAQQAEAVSVFFSNIAFALGAHLNYKRRDKDEQYAEGPLFRSE